MMLVVNEPSPSKASTSGASKAAACRAWLEMEALIQQQLGRTLAAQPYRMFLLELYLAELEHTPLFQSCFAAGEAPANAHRRAAKLADMGALIREADREDHRRRDLRLAPKVRLAMNRIISGTVVLQAALGDAALHTTRPEEDGADKHSYPKGSASASISDGDTMHKARLTAGCRITLPPDLLRSLGLQEGDAVLMQLQGGELRVRSARRTLALIQRRLKMLVFEEKQASSHLITQRRAEVARE